MLSNFGPDLLPNLSSQEEKESILHTEVVYCLHNIRFSKIVPSLNPKDFIGVKKAWKYTSRLVGWMNSPQVTKTCGVRSASRCANGTGE